MDDEILDQYTKREEINKIFSLIKSKRLIKTNHFYERIFIRNISEKLIDDIFQQEDKIKLIDKRKHKDDFGYDLTIN